MKTPEGKLKDQIKAFLKERGAYYYMPVPSGYSTPTVDFVGCYHGFFFAIEAKAPGQKPTSRQIATIRTMQGAGAWAGWWDDFDKFKSDFLFWIAP